MRKIVLHSAATSNAGAYLDAGSKVEVGSKPDQIEAKRADKLIEVGKAVTASEAAEEERAADQGGQAETKRSK